MGLSVLAWVAAAKPAAAAPPSAHSVTDVWLTAAEQAACHLASETLVTHSAEVPISSLGTVAYDDQRLARVFSPVSGMVTKIIAPLGARVERGDPLALLTSADMAGAKADLDRASAALLAASEAAERQRTLFRQKAASARDVDSAGDALRRAQAERARAAQQFALLTDGKKTATERTFVLRSPMAGEVVAREVGLGSQVRGQYSGASGAPLFTVADLSSVWLLADLPEGDVGRVQRGAQAVVRSGSPAPAPADGSSAAPPSHGEPFGPSRSAASNANGMRLPGPAEGPPIVGTVDWLADVLDPLSHTLKLRCAVDNHDRRLRPNMRVVLDIDGRGEAGLSLPASAVVFLEQQPYAFLWLEPRADGAQHLRLRPIELDDNSPDAQPEPAQADAAAMEADAAAPASQPATSATELSSKPAPPGACAPAPAAPPRRRVQGGLAVGERIVSVGAACALEALARAGRRP